jgi:hypothetical protein
LPRAAGAVKDPGISVGMVETTTSSNSFRATPSSSASPRDAAASWNAPTIRRDCREALNEAMKKMVKRIEEIFPIIGTVAAIPDSNQVTIKLGKRRPPRADLYHFGKGLGTNSL